MDADGWLDELAALTGEDGKIYDYKVNPRQQWYVVYDDIDKEWCEPSIYPQNDEIFHANGSTYVVQDSGVCILESFLPCCAAADEIPLRSTTIGAWGWPMNSSCASICWLRRVAYVFI
jgi:hypothetical protein